MTNFSMLPHNLSLRDINAVKRLYTGYLKLLFSGFKPIYFLFNVIPECLYRESRMWK